MTTESEANILEMRGIVKDFPGVRALDHASLSVRKGEIHGLVGENGAGKSTLIKILAGVYNLDEGEIVIDGVSYSSLTSHLAEELNIQFIHQERYLVNDFSIAQSMFLGQEECFPHTPFINHKSMKRKAEEFLSNTLGVPLDADTLIRDLSVAEAQIVQIAKALFFKPILLVFDEPTAPLARKEVDILFGLIHKLKERGISIVYISHYLQEIAEICDRVTVLRNGVNVGTVQMQSTTTDQIVNLMVGRDLVELFPTRHVSIGEPVVEVENLSDGEQYKNISFTLHKGEVLGLTGLIGSGREALIDTLYGLRSHQTGSIRYRGALFSKLDPIRVVKNGLAMVPRDRRRHGLVLDLSVNNNINLSNLEEISKAGFIQSKLARERSCAMINALDIKTPDEETIVRYLSGGNQQKVVVGRWLNSGASIYLLDEPTVGIDVGAKIEIYHLINRLVEEGSGVILVSTDIPELLSMTDRILVMYRGEVIQEVNSKQTSADSLLALTTGGQLVDEGNGLR